MSASSLVLPAALMVLLAGCGGDEARVRGERPAVTAAPTAVATPSPTASATAAPTASPTASPATDPGGGDEGGNRVLVKLTLGVEDVVPAEVEVPAFLGLEFEIANRSGSERIVKFGDAVVVELLPGDTQRGVLEGLRPGEHFLDAGESGRLRIIAERAGA